MPLRNATTTESPFQISILYKNTQTSIHDIFLITNIDKSSGNGNGQYIAQHEEHHGRRYRKVRDRDRESITAVYDVREETEGLCRRQ